MKKLRAKKIKSTSLTTLPVLIEQDKNGIYVGTVPSLRSCYTQGRTLAELYKNLQEVVELSLEVEKEMKEGVLTEVISMADAVLQNNGTKEEFFVAIDSALAKVARQKVGVL